VFDGMNFLAAPSIFLGGKFSTTGSKNAAHQTPQPRSLPGSCRRPSPLP
jgi:hypothetical protein